jgi:KTSC domain
MPKPEEIALDYTYAPQILAIGHYPDTKTLAVLFQPKGDKPSALYHYANVTHDDYFAFKTADSVDDHFQKVIRPFVDKFPYTRIR